MKKINRVGYTLVELLAIIIIITLVMGLGLYFSISVINNSDEKVYLTTVNSIKSSGISYALEKNNEIIWLEDLDNADEEYVCISLRTLVDYGYFKNELFDNDRFKEHDYVMVKRDKVSNSIILEDFSTESNLICTISSLESPTCNNVVYDKGEHLLVNNFDNTKMVSDKIVKKEVNSGTYNYNISLANKNNTTWEDGTGGVKELSCKIEKASCKVTLDDKLVQYTGDSVDFNLDDLKILDVEGESINNYDSSNVLFKYYLDSSYKNVANEHKSIGKYYVNVNVNLDNYECYDTAVLEIYDPIYTISLDSQGSDYQGTENIYLEYGKGIYLDSDLSKKMSTSTNGIEVPTKTGYVFGGYYTEKSGKGTQLINSAGKITSSFLETYYKTDSTLYAKWTLGKYTITLDNQSATSAGTSKIYSKYNTGIYLDSDLSKKMSTSTNGIEVPTKTGYKFLGYYTKKNGEGTQLINETGKITSYFTNTYVKENYILYANWVMDAVKISFSGDVQKYRYENFDLWSDVSVSGGTVTTKKITLNGSSVSNTKTLSIGTHTITYYAKNTSGSEYSVNRTVKIISSKKSYACVQKEVSYTIPVSGYYSIVANGAQGSNNGGLGGKVYGKMKFTKGNVIKINVGCQNGYNGGGKDAYSSGGGATTIQLNNSYVLVAAGGAGNTSLFPGELSSSSHGGAGNGSGSVKGVNGGGGAATYTKIEAHEECVETPNPDYACEPTYTEIIDTSVCKKKLETCTPEEKTCLSYKQNDIIIGNIVIPGVPTCQVWQNPVCVDQCIEWGTKKIQTGTKCNSLTIKTCYDVPETYSTTVGQGGASSVVDSSKSDFSFMSGQQSGNGNLAIEYVGETK